MTVETVETVVAAAPYAALIGHKLRPLLSDTQRSLIVNKMLFKYDTSFHEMENFPWCASPRAFQRYQI